MFLLARNAFNIARQPASSVSISIATSHHKNRCGRTEEEEEAAARSLFFRQIPSAFFLRTSSSHIFGSPPPKPDDEGGKGVESSQLCPLMVTEKWHLRASHFDIIPPKGRQLQRAARAAARRSGQTSPERFDKRVKQGAKGIWGWSKKWGAIRKRSNSARQRRQRRRRHTPPWMARTN